MQQKSHAKAAKVQLSGQIERMSVPWLFQDIRVQSRTGTAIFEYVQELTAAKIVKKIYFKNGDILFAQSNLMEDRLSDRLLQAGKLTQVQHDALAELVEKTGKKAGTLLVELGFLPAQKLVESVKDQVKAIVLSLFALKMGSFRFEEGPFPADEVIPLQMSTGNLTLEGVNNLDWQVMRKSLPSPDTVIRPAADPSNLFQDAHLSEEQRNIFGLVDGRRTIEQVCALSGIGDFNALKAVYLLLALRMAEVGAIKEPEPQKAARQPVSEPLPEFTVTRESIIAAQSAMEKQTHYEVLGVDRTASPQDIKRYYFRLAKAYHPDRHFDQAMADLKSTLEALFMRVHSAYETLSDPAKRSEYDRTLQPVPSRAAGGAEFVEKRAEEYQENYREKAARAAEQFEAGMKEFKIGNYWGAEEKFAWACRMDPIKAPYFFYLGLCLGNIPRRKHEAEENLQKAIELDPTKVEYHIELSNLYLRSSVKGKALAVLNNALNHVSWADKVEDAIAAAKEGKASAVVYGEEGGTGRKGPAESPRSGKSAVNRAQAAQAEAEFAKGMKEFKANNFGLAVEPLGAAVRLDSAKAQHHFYYGAALARTEKRWKEAEAPLLKALELDASKMEHYLELGTFYLKSGLKAKALGVLNNALLRYPNAPRVLDAIKSAGGSGR